MAIITTMGLSQIISSLTHQVEHGLGIIFYSCFEFGDLGMGCMQRIPLSWTDHLLVSFRFSGSLKVYKGREPNNLPALESYEAAYPGGLLLKPLLLCGVGKQGGP